MTRICTIFIGSVFAVSGAFAQEKSAKSGLSEDLAKEFKSMDKNGDGYLSKNEVQPAMQKSFDKADKNHDGKLDHAEYQDLKAEMSPNRSLGTVPPKTSSAPKK